MKRHTQSCVTPGKKGTVPICAKHPSGLRGKWGQSPFSLSPAARGFTLVELLVVISIIGILTALTIPAVWAVVLAGRRAAVKIELNQLEMALKAYKEKFGEYPPDGTDLAAIDRHLRKAFPRYAGDHTTLPIPLTPWNSLVFWLGGMRDGTGRPIGFSANPQNPFETTTTSRIGPFFEFDTNRLGGAATLAESCRYWPTRAVPANRLSANALGAIVYFNAQNGGYFGKIATDADGSTVILPAIDTRQSNLECIEDPPQPYSDPPVYGWVNPQSIQIFSSGLDMLYSSPSPRSDQVDDICLMYPTGENYNYDDPAGRTFDDITNFSGGTLESDIP